MRPEAAETARRPPTWKHQHGSGQTLLAAVLLAVVFAVPLFAATWPQATAVASGGAVVVAILARWARWRRDSRPREICIPGIGVCVRI